ncbi:MAG: amino acid ABC transporter permease [Planctomycetaceae bacterium]|nr:amino acid ABC transporter permease [Planctomycetaceae bacterium]
MDYDWDFSTVLANWRALASGAVMTILISLGSIVIGSVAGLAVGLCRSSSRPLLRAAAAVYVEVLLCIPILVLLIWLYYCLPIVLGVAPSGPATAITALSLSLSAFFAEAVRGGLLSVPEGQYDAAAAVGLSRTQAYLHIILPQAFRVSLPAILTLYVSTIKLTSLASVIAVYELVHTGRGIVASTFRPLEVFTVLALFYVVILMPLMLLVRRVESLARWRLA